ncbi:MAG: hypothetical protein IJH12_08825 [Clostridia bacterium]|nr:hypothetical protein [Clostridia bacterium]
MSIMSERKKKNMKIELIDKYIKESDEIIKGNIVVDAENIQDEIISVFSSEISNIKEGLSNYNMYGIYNENYKVDFIKDLKLLKAKLENYKANICCNEDNDGNKNSIQNQVITNIYNNIEVSINTTIEQIKQFPEDILKQEEKEFIEEKLSSIERLMKNKDKSGVKSKLLSIIKYLGDKSIDVIIALLPLMGSIVNQMAKF